MEEKKLHSLITTLLKMAIEQEKTGKYNQVIMALLAAEGITNAAIMDHHGGQVVSFTNAEGGIVLLGD